MTKWFLILMICVGCILAQKPEDQPKPAIKKGLDEKHRKAIEAAMDKGVRFLRSSLNEEGHLGDPGLTALALAAFFQTPRKYGPEDGPWIRKGIEFLAQCQKEDGGIYRDQLRCYTTAVALMALTAHPEVAKQYAATIEKAKLFLVKLQCDEGEGYSPEKDKFYGGFGYGSSERPDLSNTQFALEALKDAGLPSSDPAFQKAIHFLQRCQNRSESNDQKWAGNDGGFVYYPGLSNAGPEVLSDGTQGQRSYGSMTYAGIKSYIYANLTQDDPRVQAALSWIQKNYDLSENPGAGLQGLFYYYHTFAKTLDVLNMPVVTDDKGVSHNWKEELSNLLLSRQNPDGSWKNTNPRWWEAEPKLVTSYAILCLSLCLK